MEKTSKTKCVACPRKCGADRHNGVGFCGVGEKFRIARVGLHKWEEPCISYGKGSGTVFFSGCSLKCVFCQNYEISNELKGKDIDASRLLYELQRLCDMGAVNINLVNPTHYAHLLCNILEKFKSNCNIPIVYNTGGYDSVETLRNLNGLIDIYLPDIKYFSDEYAFRYSRCHNYFETALEALHEMHLQVGYAKLDKDGHMTRGVIVRHLVLPGLYRDSIEILNRLSKEFDVSKLTLSLMSQYFPAYKACEYSEINRKTTTLEYSKVVDFAKQKGFTRGYVQEKSSANEKYVPEFDYSI